MADIEQLMLLKNDVAKWNKWREKNPDVLVDLNQANLRETDLSEANLTEANIYNANLYKANLYRANLNRANLNKANLRETDLSEANLYKAQLYKARIKEANLHGANLCGANLYKADLSGADLVGANLARATFISTSLNGANLSGSHVYGTSAWNVTMEGVIQTDLVITRSDESAITVDNLEVAQFMYLLLKNEKIRQVIDTITSKVVLILGRFTKVRINVLNALREELRKHNLSPVLFDSGPASNQDVTDSVTLLARMARFVIADLTDPRSVQQELALIAPSVIVAIRPIILAGEEPWSLIGDLQRRSAGLLPVHEYRDIDDLVLGLQKNIVAPAEAKRKELLPDRR